MSPREALERAIASAMAYTAANKPGALVQRLDRETRDALSKLTSDEARNTRLDWKR